MPKTLLFSITRKEFDVQTFAVGGNGGSGKDTCNSGVRIVHKASGAAGRAVDTRSQHKNRELALERLVKSKEFQAWHKLECARRLGQTQEIEKLLNESMSDENLKIEYF